MNGENNNSTNTNQNNVPSNDEVNVGVNNRTNNKPNYSNNRIGRMPNRGMNKFGKGATAAGSGLNKAGRALSKTGAGAAIGLPLSAIGAATSAVGKATSSISKAKENKDKNQKAKTTDNKNTSSNDTKSSDEKGAKAKEGKVSSKERNSKKKNDILGKLTVRKALKTKMILIAIGIGAGLIFIVLFIVVLITPLMTLGIIDIGDTSGTSGDSSLTYSSIEGNTSYWWPIGSEETDTIDGKTFATGTPVATSITSTYDENRVINGQQDVHTGMDIAVYADYGVVNVIAAQSGKVILAKDSPDCPSNTEVVPCNGSGYGNYVKIEDASGVVIIYAHMHQGTITVKEGDYVEQGQVIGKVGSSGKSTGAHLHFEVRVNGSPVAPLNYVSSDNPRPISKTTNYVEGSNEKESICLTLKASGFSNNGVIALMTNIYNESTFNPTSYNPDDNGGPSYGLCQWHNERYENLKASFPDNYQTVAGQISYLSYELSNSYSALNNNLKNSTKSARDLTYDFCYSFEVPYDTTKTCNNRASQAKDFESYVRNGCK